MKWSKTNMSVVEAMGFFMKLVVRIYDSGRHRRSNPGLQAEEFHTLIDNWMADPDSVNSAKGQELFFLEIIKGLQIEYGYELKNILCRLESLDELGTGLLLWIGKETRGRMVRIDFGQGVANMTVTLGSRKGRELSDSMFLGLPDKASGIAMEETSGMTS